MPSPQRTKFHPSNPFADPIEKGKELPPIPAPSSRPTPRSTPIQARGERVRDDFTNLREFSKAVSTPTLPSPRRPSLRQPYLSQCSTAVGTAEPRPLTSLRTIEQFPDLPLPPVAHSIPGRSYVPKTPTPVPIPPRINVPTQPAPMRTTVPRILQLTLTNTPQPRSRASTPPQARYEKKMHRIASEQISLLDAAREKERLHCPGLKPPPSLRNPNPRHDTSTQSGQYSPPKGIYNSYMFWISSVLAVGGLISMVAAITVIFKDESAGSNNGDTSTGDVSVGTTFWLVISIAVLLVGVAMGVFICIRRSGRWGTFQRRIGVDEVEDVALMELDRHGRDISRGRSSGRGMEEGSEMDDEFVLNRDRSRRVGLDEAEASAIVGKGNRIGGNENRTASTKTLIREDSRSVTTMHTDSATSHGAGRHTEVPAWSPLETLARELSGPGIQNVPIEERNSYFFERRVHSAEGVRRVRESIDNRDRRPSMVRLRQWELQEMENMKAAGFI